MTDPAAPGPAPTDDPQPRVPAAGDAAAGDSAADPGAADSPLAGAAGASPVAGDEGVAEPHGADGGVAQVPGRVRLAGLVRGPALRHAGGYGASALAGVIFTAVVLLGTGTAGRAGSAPQATTALSAPAVVASSTQPPAAPAAAGAAEAAVLGRADAPVSIEIWADYQCPYCALLARGVEPSIVRAYVDTGQATLTYHDFAFLGPESVAAATGARCASRQGAFWRYHDLLYAFQQGENQGTFSSEVLAGIAGFAGLDEDAFTACLSGGSTTADVTADTGRGRALGITSTPTIRFIGHAGTLTLRGVPQWEQVTLTMDRVTGRAPMPAPSAGASPAAGSPGPAGTPGAVSGASPVAGSTPVATPTIAP